MATTKKSPAAKKSAKSTSSSGSAKSAIAKKAPSRKTSATKDPKGGLTAAGRKKFAETEGAHLRPGVQGKADTPDKMVRKGSFLRRHFANPQGPMERDGEPTRLALSAQAWGEPVPKTDQDAKKLAETGHELLEQYHAVKEGAKGTGKGKTPAKKSSGRKTPAKKRAGSE